MKSIIFILSIIFLSSCSKDSSSNSNNNPVKVDLRKDFEGIYRFDVFHHYYYFEPDTTRRINGVCALRTVNVFRSASQIPGKIYSSSEPDKLTVEWGNDTMNYYSYGTKINTDIELFYNNEGYIVDRLINMPDYRHSSVQSLEKNYIEFTLDDGVNIYLIKGFRR